jgi:hypothetical protein
MPLLPANLRNNLLQAVKIVYNQQSLRRSCRVVAAKKADGLDFIGKIQMQDK